MRNGCPSRANGFSLIELVMVVCIIALLGAIAIPRLSRGSAGAAASALTADLDQMNKALDLYAAEHGGNFPATDLIADQLTQFTDDAGNTSPTSDAAHLFGPYLRTIPPLPLGANKGNYGIAASTGAGVGWIYDINRGAISANSSLVATPVEIGDGPAGVSGGAGRSAGGGASLGNGD